MPASGGAGSPLETMVERWCAADRVHAFVKSDREVIESTASVRMLIAEHLLAPPPRGPQTPRAETQDRDLLNAFGVLGRLVAERGGSPTLAAAIVDGALEVLGPAAPVPAWALPARAALAEAFALSRHEASQAEGASRWEYPRCAVGLPDGTVAIAAGFPDDDLDALGAWASRLAQEAALAGVRRVVISGSARAEYALESALDVVGISLVPGRRPPTRHLPLRR